MAANANPCLLRTMKSTICKYHFMQTNIAFYCHFRKLSIKRILNLCNEHFGKEYNIFGWIRTIRNYKEFMFVDVFDGSTSQKLQILLDNKLTESHPVYVGSAVHIKGILKESPYKGQRVEIHGSSLSVVGEGNLNEYPLKPKVKISPELPRRYPHLRLRTPIFSATLRVRSRAACAIHDILQTKNYFCIHTPVITTNDCEGGGAVFTVQPSTAVKSTHNAEKKTSEQKEWFFGVPAYLTVSGQLQLEAAASAFCQVYSFGPTFRAEHSRTQRHLSEFYMLEIEKAFVSTVEEIMEVCEWIIKELTEKLLHTCPEEIHLLHNEHSLQQKNYLEKMIELSFPRITYSEAVGILEKKNDSFINSIKWGQELGAEHEKYLIKYCNNQPLFITNFPANIKPFYMKHDNGNTKGKLALCFDLLVPHGGELCGGSLREDNMNVLVNRLKELHLDETLSWYTDLRKFGAVPHGGFGMGFERYLQYLLGVSNIKDTIPFPRRANLCLL